MNYKIVVRTDYFINLNFKKPEKNFKKLKFESVSNFLSIKIYFLV